MPKKYLEIEPKEKSTLLDLSDLSNIAIIFLSLDLKVTSYNDTAKKIYQWKEEEIQGKSYLDWCKKNKIVSPISLEDNKSLEKIIPVTNIENDINDGQYVINWKIMPNVDKNKNLKEIVLIGNDITLEKSFEVQMKR